MQRQNNLFMVDDHILGLIVANLSIFGELDVANGGCGAELRKIQFRLQVALSGQSDDANSEIRFRERTELGFTRK